MEAEKQTTFCMTNRVAMLNATKMEDGTEICPVITATYYKDGVHNFLFAPQYRKPCVIEIQDETEDEGDSNTRKFTDALLHEQH